MNEGTTIRVAVAQTLGTLHAAPANVRDACRLAREAAAQKARLILFPEAGLTGHSLSTRDAQAALPATEEHFTELQRTADEEDITICAGFMTPLGGELNSAFAIVAPHTGLRFQHKCARSTAEPKFLDIWPDPTRTVFSVDGVRIVIVICSEYGIPAIEAAVLEAAPDVILHPSAGVLRVDELTASTDTESVGAALSGFRSVVEGSVSEIARRGIPKASANPIGFDGESYWPGNSYVIGGDGQILLWMEGESVAERMRASVGVVDVPVAKKSIQSETATV